MTEGFDMYGGMTRALLGREGAWAFVRDFAACWERPLAPGDGWDEGEIDAAERRLGVRLPRRCGRRTACSGGGTT
ncbi:hypothetical protein [Streptomyces phaeoluteigriseus]|uniref:hypothetical protein n=1 Tax=Streptomyces phaeoluteigriseus TaxID=114686 RepID=UPI000A50655F|nr:hypothetical protein [Streptomyces phaeoluteigriseus]